MTLYASVALDIALDKLLDYSIPSELISQIKVGMRVEVPVKNQFQKGYIVVLKEQASFLNVRPLSKLLTDVELITPPLFELALWMSNYYCTPLRQILKTLVPASIRGEMQHKQQKYVMRKKTREEIKDYCEKARHKFPSQVDILDIMLKVKKGILLTELLEKSGKPRSSVDSLVKKGFLELDIVRVDRSPIFNEEYFKTKPKTLNQEQAEALQKITSSLTENRFETHLLFGVTGSGKTEVYMQAIEKALELKKGVLMLVPEISLTAQTIERFQSRFDHKMAVLHHRLSEGERFDEWHKIRRGESLLVIGARSAIFSPIHNLGLIIVDEEHEQSYKQSDEQPCYNARDLAVMRGKLSSSTIILGSATPSLESYYNVINKKYTLSKLTSRPETAYLPTIKIIDMKREFEKAQGFTNFSEELIEGIKKRIEIGEQTILFLNRRGYHTMLLCPSCHESVKCQHCDISLTFHLGENCLACHLCGFNLSPPPQKCPKCRQENPLKFRGVGTELIEKNLHALFPGIRSLRIDADSTRHKGSLQKLLKAFSVGKADVLIGTQMIAKGLHFPAVTLVGILNCDTSLNIPDFRASETVFQLITQVSGRAGRGEKKGEVVLQTSMPENKIIQLASEGDYEKFFNTELEIRKTFNFPPFTQMVKISFTGEKPKETFAYAENVRQWLVSRLAQRFEWHPVIEAGYAKVKGKYRFQFLFRGNNLIPFQQAIQEFRLNGHFSQKIKMRIDVNPLSTY